MKPGPLPTSRKVLYTGARSEENEVDNRHLILMAMTVDGQGAAIDLTGAQYGYEKVLLNWREFEIQRMKGYQSICSLE